MDNEDRWGDDPSVRSMRMIFADCEKVYNALLAETGVSPFDSRIGEIRKKARAGNRNYYYTHSQHRNVEALHKESPEPITEIGPKTAEKYGIKDGDEVVVETNRGQVRMKAMVDERVAEGVAFVPHGWEGVANANLLTDAHCREPIMGYPE